LRQQAFVRFRISAHFCLLESPSEFFGIGNGGSARLTKQPGCRPAMRKTKLDVVSVPKNRVCPYQLMVF
jgi:hypothetical protein